MYDGLVSILQRAFIKLAERSEQFSRCCGAIVGDSRAQGFILGAIVANAMMLGMATFEFQDESIVRLLDTFDVGFLIFFSVELGLHFGHKGPVGIVRDSWLCFDTLVIIASWTLEGLQVARAFRIIRAVRLITQLKALKSVLAALIRVLPRLYSVVGLFAILLYIYAVLCTEMFGDMYKKGLTDDDYFGSLGKSLFTLFQFITAENWNHIARQVKQHVYWSQYLFGSFVVMTNFVLYSLLAAVFCHAIATPDEEMIEAMRLLQQIHAKVEAAHERQILGLCQCQILMPQKDLAVFSPKRRSKVLPRQVSFALRRSSRVLMPSMEETISSHFDNRSTLSVLSEDLIAYGDFQFKKVKTFRERFKEIIDDSRFQFLSSLLVVVNAVTLGVETFDFGSQEEYFRGLFEVINRVFLVFFTIELGVNLYASGGIRKAVQDPWLCFDSVIVGFCWAVESLSIARALRVIRIFQLGRRFNQLQKLLEALVKAAPNISGVLCFLVLVMYIYAVFTTELFGYIVDTPDGVEYDYFGRLDKSAFTLFQIMTLEGWGAIARDIQEVYFWSWFVFCSYLFLTSATLFSMIIGYMTDAVKGTGYVSKRELDNRVRHLHRKLQTISAQHQLIQELTDYCVQKQHEDARGFA